MFRLSDYIRSCTGNDAGKDERTARWDEVGEEAENEMAGLAVSYLTVQALVFCITGSLPRHSEHKHQVGVHHVGSDWSVLMLLFVAFVFAAMTVLLVACGSRVLRLRQHSPRE